MTDNDQQFQVRFSEDQLVAWLKSRFSSLTSPCSFCGGREERNVKGIHWLSASAELAYLAQPTRPISPDEAPTLDTTAQVPMRFMGPALDPRPGFIPCFVITCSSCGNVWLLSLNELGIFNVERKEPPKLRLVRD